MALEYIYPLNLPQFDSVGTPSVLETMAAQEGTRWQAVYPPSEVLLPEWVTMNGISWKGSVVSSRTPSCQTAIRTDAWGTTNNPWSVMWLYGNSNQIDYWDPSTVDTPTEIVGSFGLAITTYQSILAPTKTYTMAPGAYLVCTSVPYNHVITDDRFTILLSDYSKFTMTWEEVVAEFTDLILTP
jgi:hypothetical protein